MKTRDREIKGLLVACGQEILLVLADRHEEIGLKNEAVAWRLIHESGRQPKDLRTMPSPAPHLKGKVSPWAWRAGCACVFDDTWNWQAECYVGGNGPLRRRARRPQAQPVRAQ